MSTKSTIFYDEPKGSHKLNIHIYNDLHEPSDTAVVELGCSTCKCSYTFLMSEHLARQLANRLRQSKK